MFYINYRNLDLKIKLMLMIEKRMTKMYNIDYIKLYVRANDYKLIEMCRNKLQFKKYSIIKNCYTCFDGAFDDYQTGFEMRKSINKDYKKFVDTHFKRCSLN